MAKKPNPRKPEGSCPTSEEPEFVTRFRTLCDEFQNQALKQGKPERVVGNRNLYQIHLAVLEQRIGDNSQYRSLTKVGKYKQIYGESYYEIDLDALEKFEAQFLDKGNDQELRKDRLHDVNIVLEA